MRPLLSLTCASLLLLISLGCSPHEWSPTALNAESARSPECQEEIEESILHILGNDGLLDPSLREEVLEALLDEGEADQFINLYGGDEVRHWVIARFEDDQCYLYNQAVTEIDIASRERQRAERPVRSWPETRARISLRRCECQG